MFLFDSAKPSNINNALGLPFWKGLFNKANKPGAMPYWGRYDTHITALSITTFSIMTLSKMTFTITTLSTMTFSIVVNCHLCWLLLVLSVPCEPLMLCVVLNVVMLSVILLGVVVPYWVLYLIIHSSTEWYIR